MSRYLNNGIPLEAQYLVRRARILAKHGKSDLAITSLKQAAFIAPKFARIYHEMGNCYRNLGRYDDALTCYDRALGIDPLLTEALSCRGHVMALIGPCRTGLPGGNTQETDLPVVIG